MEFRYETIFKKLNAAVFMRIGLWRFSLIDYPSPLYVFYDQLFSGISDDSHLKNRVVENYCLLAPLRVHTLPFTTGSLMRDNYPRQWWPKGAERPGNRHRESGAGLETPRRDRLERRCDDTALGRHYHIRATVTGPVLERVPRAGIPVVKRRNEENEE